MQSRTCGRLIAATRGDTTFASYLYNATGERLAKRLANGTEQRFFYNEASQLIAERGEDARDYVWLGGLPVAVIDTTQGRSTLRAIHADHLGTPRVITDGEGKVVWSWSLHDDPFGENAPVSSSGYVFHLRFAGQYYDQETGLHYNLQRYYDPTVGRYVTSDPLGLSAGINTFAYVDGNPISYIDPLGLRNWSKTIVSIGNTFNAGRLYVAGSLRVAAGLGMEGTGIGAPAGAVTVGLGAWNISSAQKTWARAQQQWAEAACEDSSKYSTADKIKTFSGLLPWGTESDDPNEAYWLDVAGGHIRDAWDKPWAFLQEIGSAAP